MAQDEQDAEKEANAKMVQGLRTESNDFDSPINITIARTIPIQIPEMIWVRHTLMPKKMKLSNTGQTIILSAKWLQIRPYLKSGPLNGYYTFCQLHFHWGKDAFEGSEHKVDDSTFPMEMHVVYFKSSYKTQKDALKQSDGVVVCVYLFQIQKMRNPGLQFITDAIPSITKAKTANLLDPIPLSALVPEIKNDYFLYWGAVTNDTDSTLMLWMISRTTIGISTEQLQKFQTLLDSRNQQLVRNFRPALESKRRVFHINPSSYMDSTLYPRINDSQRTLTIGYVQQRSNQSHNSNTVNPEGSQTKAFKSYKTSEHDTQHYYMGNDQRACRVDPNNCRTNSHQCCRMETYNSSKGCQGPIHNSRTDANDGKTSSQQSNQRQMGYNSYK